MKTNRSILIAIISSVLATAAAGQGVPSASELLQRMNPTTQPQAPKADTPQTMFAQKAQALAKEAATLPPEQAAARWLELFDAESKADPRAASSYRPDEDSDALMSALPPPSAWPALMKAIDARPLPNASATRGHRRELALRAMGHLLTNDMDWVRANAKELEALNSPAVPSYRRWNGDTNLMAMLLGEQEKPAEVAEMFAQSVQDQDRGTVEVPDLVTLVGAAKAEELLRTALSNPVILSVNVGDETRKLAQKLALEMVGTLRRPQWQLVTPSSLELYEAMAKRFSPSTQPGGTIWGIFSRGASRDDAYAYLRVGAEQQYILGLIIAGRSDDAVRLIKQRSSQGEEHGLDISSYRGMAHLDQMGRSQQVYQTLNKILADNPDLPLWELYRSVAVKTNHTQEMLTLARNAAARPGLTPEQTRSIRRMLSSVLLAADVVDEAVEVIEKQLADTELPADEKLQLAINLARIGRLLKQPAWVNRGIDAAKAALNSNVPAEENYLFSRTAISLVHELQENGRNAEALELIGAQLAKLAATPQEQRRVSYMQNPRDLLLAAIKIYHDAGRHADVLELLDKAPAWQAGDLSQLLGVRGQEGASLAYMAATALANTGRNDAARKIVHALLDRSGGMDPAYELLVKIDGANAIAKLDDLFSRDRFEERPLIWKGSILRGQGQLDEAERIVRQAIAIDPSDGEQGRGDRMRVYAVLADILAAKGNPQQAEIFRGAVRAIRLSEDADLIHAAGLLKRAVDMYRTALTHFADAYCIQSRLAIQLMELGFEDLAMQHYQKAYELMPDSFGRVESHCFGCEGAFTGQTAQSIAERVFVRLAREQPNKPQVHYLLGYLRQSQGRHKDAIDSFRTAVRLDPDYLNAWKHLKDAESHLYVAQTERDTASLAILRLDPLSRHSDSDLSNVRDLKALWEASAVAVKFQPPTPPGDLLRLTTSAAELAKLTEVNPSMTRYFPTISSPSYDRQRVLSPAEAVSSTMGVQALRNLMRENQ